MIRALTRTALLLKKWNLWKLCIRNRFYCVKNHWQKKYAHGRHKLLDSTDSESHGKQKSQYYNKPGLLKNNDRMLGTGVGFVDTSFIFLS